MRFYANLVDLYGKEWCVADTTTRANIQLHRIKMEDSSTIIDSMYAWN